MIIAKVSLFYALPAEIEKFILTTASHIESNNLGMKEKCAHKIIRFGKKVFKLHFEYSGRFLLIFIRNRIKVDFYFIDKIKVMQKSKD